MVKYKTSDLDEWTDRTDNISVQKVEDVLFSDLFHKYLPKNSRLSCIEIGAIPGSFLVYLNKKFGYKITGLDFADNEEIFKANMAANGIKKYEFIKADFLKFKSSKKYDVVCSFGFIEHFDDYADVIRRHCDLVSEGGYLVLTTPNFRYLQYAYHRVFDKPNLDIHNTKVMSPKRVARIVGRYGFVPLYAGYTGNLEIWRHTQPLSPRLARWNSAVEKLAQKHKSLPTSKLYSPYTVCIFRRIA